MEAISRFGDGDWFSLGDKDLATHLHRTGRMAEGASLTEVTAELARGWGLGLAVLPVTEDPVRTMVTTVDEGEVSFQRYFVGRRHDVAVTGVRFAGIEAAAPTPGVLDSIGAADVVLVAPSNPVVSIDPVLSVPGVREAVAARRADVVAISPIVGGAALKGPAANMLTELGEEASAVGVARRYADAVGTLVLDSVDAELAAPVETAGVRAVVTDTIMSDPDRAAALAAVVIDPATRHGGEEPAP